MVPFTSNPIETLSLMPPNAYRELDSSKEVKPTSIAALDGDPKSENEVNLLLFPPRKWVSSAS